MPKLYDFTGGNISNIAQAIPAALEAYQSAQNQQLRQMEFQAKMKAQEEDRRRQIFETQLKAREMGLMQTNPNDPWDAQGLQATGQGYMPTDPLKKLQLYKARADVAREGGDPDQVMYGQGGLMAQGQGLIGQQGGMLPQDPDMARIAGEAREKKSRERLEKDVELQNKLKPNAAELNAATFVRKMEQAEAKFEELSNKGFKREDPRTALKTAVEYLPFGVGESLKPNELKQQEQAERNFVNSVLRPESGASISESEFESARAQYFPRAGDSPEVVAQKKQTRLLAIEGLKQAAGRAYKQGSSSLSKSKSKGKQPPNGAMTVQQNGHTYNWNSSTGEYE